MPLIQVPVGIAPCHVDFPVEVTTGEKDAKGKPVMRKMERSCKGSLYLRPASTRNLTDDELTWLRTNPEWKTIGMRLNVIKVKNVGGAVEAKVAPAPTPKAEAPKEVAMPMDESTDDSDGSWGGKKKNKNK